MENKEKSQKQRQRIAVIRVRGVTGVNPRAVKTMEILKLYRKNYCTIIENNESAIGMLNVVKDFVTFGELDKQTFSNLLEKRGRLSGNKKVTPEYIKQHAKIGFSEFVENFITFKSEMKSVPGLKGFFRLNPPKGGFEKKGIKHPFSVGGVLGYRGKEINKLIERML